MILRAYFDDAGTHLNSDVVVMGGLVGTFAQWEKFEREWAARLADPLPGYGKPPLEMFHLSACVERWPGSEFEIYTDAEKDAVIHDFRRIALDAKLTSTASAIDKKAWDELVVGPYRKVLGDALTQCFFDCIDETVRFTEPHLHGFSIAVVVDEGIWTNRLQEIGDEWTSPFRLKRVTSVTFGRVKEVLPLQGADIVATGCYWHAAKWLKLGDAAKPHPHQQDYLVNMLHQGRILDREGIEIELQRRGPDGRVLGT
jgi:hypothetical protein